MTYTALAISYLIVCVCLGLWGGARATRPLFAATLAAAMVAVQFAFLVSR